MIRLAAAIGLVATMAAADPVISIDITLAENEEYHDAIAVIKKAGAQATSLALFWADLEPEPGVYAPKDNWPVIANLYLPTTGLDFTLSFSVIDTVTDRRPADLQSLPWDDPQVIARFNAHATAVLTRMPRVPIIAIAVGNEVDAHLTTPADVAAFARFLSAARTHIATIRPGIPIAAKLTFSGLAADAVRLEPILHAGDAAFLTYYPLNPDFSLRPVSDVPTDFDRMIAFAAGRPLWLLEAGYPSGGCKATTTGQADFVTAVRMATKNDQAALISFTYLADLPDDVIDGYASYYGIATDCFRRYLGTLGLRTTDGTAKPALAAIAAPAP